MPTALHIRSSDLSAAALIDAWTARHQLKLADCADAFDACVALLRHPDHVPEVAFVAIDGLAPEERDILRYIRATWPAVVLVTYSDGGGHAAPAPAPFALHCASTAALREALSADPEQLLRRARRYAAPQPQAAPLPPRVDGGRPAEAPPARQNGDAPHAAPRAAPPPEPDAHRPILSAEELAALLDDDA